MDDEAHESKRPKRRAWLSAFKTIRQGQYECDDFVDEEWAPTKTAPIKKKCSRVLEQHSSLVELPTRDWDPSLLDHFPYEVLIRIVMSSCLYDSAKLILNLAATCHRYRTLLMREVSEDFWKRVCIFWFGWGHDNLIQPDPGRSWRNTYIALSSVYCYFHPGRTPGFGRVDLYNNFPNIRLCAVCMPYKSENWYLAKSMAVFHWKLNKKDLRLIPCENRGTDRRPKLWYSIRGVIATSYNKYGGPRGLQRVIEKRKLQKQKRLQARGHPKTMTIK